MAAAKHSVWTTFGVAAALSVCCSVLVTFSVVLLKDRQEVNQLIFKRANVLSAAGIKVENTQVNDTFERMIEVRYVDLQQGSYVEAPAPDFDSVLAAKDPQYKQVIAAEEDVARIKRRSRITEMYLFSEEGQLKSVILPVRGKGLWSTMIGFLALNPQNLEVQGLTFYAHGETPGLGGEIDNEKWKMQWVGKKIYDEDGAVKLKVLKGMVPADDPLKDYHVDGLSGATLTSDGVSKMVAYWLGKQGYYDFLQQQVQQGWSEKAGEG